MFFGKRCKRWGRKISKSNAKICDSRSDGIGSSDELLMPRFYALMMGRNAADRAENAPFGTFSIDALKGRPLGGSIWKKKRWSGCMDRRIPRRFHSSVFVKSFQLEFTRKMVCSLDGVLSFQDLVIEILCRSVLRFVDLTPIDTNQVQNMTTTKSHKSKRD